MARLVVRSEISSRQSLPVFRNSWQPCSGNATSHDDVPYFSLTVVFDMEIDGKESEHKPSGSTARRWHWPRLRPMRPAKRQCGRAKTGTTLLPSCRSALRRPFLAFEPLIGHFTKKKKKKQPPFCRRLFPFSSISSLPSSLLLFLLSFASRFPA